MRFSLLALWLAVPLLLPIVPRLRAESAPDPFAKWEKEIAAFEATDRESPPPKNGIVFVGSSSIKKWKTLTEDFPHHHVLNRGFGGSQLIDSVHFADRIVLPYEPRMIVLYAGGNDIHAHKTPEQVFADFQAFVEKIRTKLPKTEIAYISIAGNPSRWAEVDQVKKANALIEGYSKDHEGLKFINVFPRMLGSDGEPRPEIFVQDRLHMNPEGYKLWTEIVGSYLPAPDRWVIFILLFLLFFFSSRSDSRRLQAALSFSAVTGAGAATAGPDGSTTQPRRALRARSRLVAA